MRGRSFEPVTSTVCKRHKKGKRKIYGVTSVKTIIFGFTMTRDNIWKNYLTKPLFTFVDRHSGAIAGLFLAIVISRFVAIYINQHLQKNTRNA
jgi:hypothetical protein